MPFSRKRRKKEVKDALITFALTDEDAQRFQALCDSLKISRSALVRRVLRRHLNRHAPSKGNTPPRRKASETSD